MPPVLAWSLVGIAALVVIGVVVFFAARSSRKKTQTIPDAALEEVAQSNAVVRQPSTNRPIAAPKSIPPKPVVFRADPAAIEQLGPEQDVYKWKLKFPHGWSQDRHEVNDQSVNTIWKDARIKRDDNTFPNVQIVQVNRPGDRVDALYADVISAMQRRLNSQAEGLQEISRSTVEVGTINGIRAARARISARNPTTNRVAHQVVYLFFANDQLVEAVTGLTEPGHELAIKLGEASILSMRR